MDADLISFETMIATKEAAKWAFGAMVGTWVAAIATVVALIFARQALKTWRDEKIETARAEWIASLVDYTSNISFLPDLIHWDEPSNKAHLDRVASLMYECIKRWKIFQTYLKLNKKSESKYYDLYLEKWESLSVGYHNRYMNGAVDKTAVKNIGIELYNL